jgi:hypothetical protein
MNSWPERHPRFSLTVDLLFLVAFWVLAMLKNDGFGYALAVAWTVRTVLYDWWWHSRRSRRDNTPARRDG